MRQSQFIATICLGLGLSSAVQAAVVADFAADFSAISNPTGPWSYGQTTAPGGVLTLFTNVRDGSGIGDTRYDWNPGPIIPLVGLISPFSGTPLGIMHPGAAGQFADARYVAQSNMSATLDVRFSVGDIQTATDVHVLVNGASLFSAFLDNTAPEQDYLASIVLLAGDVVEFAVGWGQNANSSFDTTYFSATLLDTAIPEPAMTGLLLAGIAGLAGLRRKSP